MNDNQENNIISELQKLGELYKEGLLTKEEFEVQKRRILAKQLPSQNHNTPQEDVPTKDSTNFDEPGPDESYRESSNENAVGPICANSCTSFLLVLPSQMRMAT